MPKINQDQKRVALNCLVRPETKQEIQERAINGKSQGQVVDEALSALYRETGTAYVAPRVDIDVAAHEAAARAIEAANPTAVRSAQKQTKRAMAIQERASSDVIARAAGRDDIDYSDTESTPTTHVATLDASAPARQKGKTDMENWRNNRKPLLKPKDRK